MVKLRASARTAATVLQPIGAGGKSCLRNAELGVSFSLGGSRQSRRQVTMARDIGHYGRTLTGRHLGETPIESAATLNRSAAVFAFQNPAPKAVEVLAVSRSGKASGIQALPLFATDAVLGAALLGDDRVQEWRQIA